MKNTYRNIAGLSIGILLIAIAIAIPRLRQDNPAVDPGIRQELLVEGQMSWESPLLQLLTVPVAHIDSYNPDTKQGIVGMYSWFGFRVGRAFLNGCEYGKAGNLNPNFGCFGGGTAEYLF